MPKEFYTERDIEDLFQRGIRSLRITENVVLTELAYEKANRLGLQLVSAQGDHSPAGPVRPYLSEAGPARTPPLTPALSQGERGNTVEERIRSAVIARLGNQVDVKLLDNIIQRVVKGVGLK